MTIAIPTAIAMLAFAANSVLARLALGGHEMDALAYTGVRLAAGAIALLVLLLVRRRKIEGLGIQGSWPAAGALFGYAVAFSAAYLMLPTGIGALILFACVQIGMLTAAIGKGDRPGSLELLGMAIAFGALVFLVSPGLVAPPPLGAALMAVAGLCWAAYSLLGRGSRSPLADTAGNFTRCLPVGLVLAVGGCILQAPSRLGLLCAVASGALASGLGYAVWYAALPRLSRVRAAIVQLTVPAIAAAGGVIVLGEAVTPRLLLSSAGIIGGVALATVAAERRKAKGAGPA
jgi:drug/metabolite transporter (DMT)-like permease